MKYLILNSLKFGGAERVAQILANNGVFDKIILLENEKDFDIDIPIVFLSQHNSKTSRIWKTFFIPVYVFRLRRFLIKDDVIVSFSERANFVNLVSKFFLKNKAFISIRTNIEASFKNRKKFFYFLLIKLLYPRADLLISVSDGVKKKVDEVLKIQDNSRSLVIKNPVDLENIDKRKKEGTFFSNNFYFKSLISSGRLSEEKNYSFLLKVFQESLKKEPGLKLLILGDGPLRDDLLSLSESLNLKTFSVFNNDILDESYNVYFMGYQENPYKFLYRAKIFISTSFFEGFPNIILEALACGLTVISSDCPYGPREILSRRGEEESELGDYGVLMSLNFLEDEKKWTDVIIKLLESPNILSKYKEKGRIRSSDFIVKNIGAKWTNILN
jgi:glycosyltransferase involved in cell wall biosynthesis